MMSAQVSLDVKELKSVIKQVDALDSAYLKVGILGGWVRRSRGQTSVRRWGAYKGGRNQGSLNNAEIGAVHEFGSPTRGIPERSFLRMPVLTRLNKELSVVKRSDWERVLRTQGLVGILKVCGQAAYNVIREAFHTGGWGRWAPLKAATIRRKKSSDILIDTTQLERSITFAVVAPGASKKALP